MKAMPRRRPRVTLTCYRGVESVTVQFATVRRSAIGSRYTPRPVADLTHEEPRTLPDVLGQGGRETERFRRRLSHPSGAHRLRKASPIFDNDGADWSRSTASRDWIGLGDL